MDIKIIRDGNSSNEGYNYKIGKNIVAYSLDIREYSLNTGVFNLNIGKWGSSTREYNINIWEFNRNRIYLKY